MRNFFRSSSPAKKAPKALPAPKTAMHQPPVHRVSENLARYLKPDGTLARAFISFRDIAPRCDTKLFETSYPLIGQRLETGGTMKSMQVGDIVLQIFRLPPLPGIPPEQLPQSLEECHRGLRHTAWHKNTYFEGTLTQNGGDCMVSEPFGMWGYMPMTSRSRGGGDISDWSVPISLHTMMSRSVLSPPLISRKLLPLRTTRM